MSAVADCRRPTHAAPQVDAGHLAVAFRGVRDLIEQKVSELIASLTAESPEVNR